MSCLAAKGSHGHVRWSQKKKLFCFMLSRVHSKHNNYVTARGLGRERSKMATAAVRGSSFFRHLQCKDLHDYLHGLPVGVLDRLYTHPATCLAVFRYAVLLKILPCAFANYNSPAHRGSQHSLRESCVATLYFSRVIFVGEGRGYGGWGWIFTVPPIPFTRYYQITPQLLLPDAQGLASRGQLSPYILIVPIDWLNWVF